MFLYNICSKKTKRRAALRQTEDIRTVVSYYSPFLNFRDFIHEKIDKSQFL